MSVADRLVVLRDGAIVAAGAPRQLYESPPARFVASFLGRSNELSATVDGDGSTAMRIGGTEVDLDAVPGEVADAPRAIVHIRPGDLTVNPATLSNRRSNDAGTAPDRSDASADGERSDNRTKTIEMRGTVTHVRDVGRRYDVRVEVDSGEEVTVERHRDGLGEADRVTVAAAASDLTVFPVSK